MLNLTFTLFVCCCTQTSLLLLRVVTKYMDIHESDSDDGGDDKSSSTKIFIILHVVKFATLVNQWHEQRMVKEPSIDFSIAREIYIRRLYYGRDRTCNVEFEYVIFHLGDFVCEE